MDILTVVLTIIFFIISKFGESRQDHAINFPEDVFSELKPVLQFRVKEPPACRSKQPSLLPEFCPDNMTLEFCLDDEQYDSHMERKFIEALSTTKSDYMMELISNDILVDPEPNLDVFPGGFSTRQYSSESPVCLGRETLIFPKRAQTANNDWVFVLNQPNLQQGVRVEVCLSEGGQCRFGSLNAGKTVCRQKYIYKKLLTMDANGSKVVPESVYLPSCCVCYLQDFGISGRDQKPIC